MSLNDYFAANGAVYLRPVGLPDCFPMPGLPHGCKPPPLAMQHPCNPPQKPRTMATVSPLHQVVPPQAPPSIASYEGGNMGFNAASRTSSFAAALRKLAKQAVDPVTGEKDLSQISPVSSPVLNQTPKRNVPSSSMFHQGAFASTSPPVVTIAPSRPVATHTSESRKQVMDLSTVPPVNNSSSLSNGHIQEPIAVKMDSSKSGPRPAHAEKWEEQNLPSKGLSASSATSQVRPHATIAPLPRPDDSLTSSRGFQPYRGSEESRNTLPHHISLFDHHPTAVSYPYTPAFLPPPHLSHPAYRFDDPLYLERYSLLRPPVMPYPQAGMMAPPAAFYPNSRYASDLIAQSLSLGGANSGILNHERLKQEEERRMREKELELDQSRSKEQERQREKEQKEKEIREREQKERDLREKEKRDKDKSHRAKEENTDHVEHKKERSSSSHNSSTKRTESPSVRTTSTIHNSSFHTATTTSTSTPLNLVVQQQHAAVEHHKKETELWMPWQQPVNHQPKENNPQDVGNSIKHPAFRSQESQNHHPPKENHTNDKVPPRFSPTIANDRKPNNPPPPTSVMSQADSKKYSADTKKFDSIHHHITELSNKDHHTPHEWRHEKLQKACTNNHRKSHESKKAKEAALAANHQRKIVNGAIMKPQPYQNEGMHARLLESEKCRLELSGQNQTKPQQNLVGLTNFKPNYNPVMSKEVALPKTYLECYTPVTAPVIKSTADLTPVVSKLDLEAKNLLRGESKLYEDDGRNEIRLKNFLIITKGPPLKLDPSPQKLKFLKLLGLTTHYKRKKIELDMYLKRRKILFEDSSMPPRSPSPEENKTNLPPLIECSLHSERLAEQLRSETTPEKLEFFFQLNLSPITLVKKEEKERIRRIVEEERVRRHYRMLAKVNRKASPRRLFVPKSEAAMKLDHLRKIREQNALFANSMYSKTQDDDVTTESISGASTQIVMPKHEQVPYILSTDASSSASNRDVTDLQYPLMKTFNRYSFKRGHSLKREFRYELTRPNAKNNHAKSPEASTSCVSVSTQVDASLLAFGMESTLAALKNSVNWPGLESIMEAFYRHQHEQSNEKTVLTDRCHQLRKTQEELKKEADSLTKHMSEVLKSKRDLEDDMFKYQRAIDRIKQCLQLGR